MAVAAVICDRVITPPMNRETAPNGHKAVSEAARLLAKNKLGRGST
jgi:hypothetical protein